jgi:rSAM/selenodomain-associated transferase 2
VNDERVSVIVPVRGDAGPLAELLHRLGDEPDEVVVVCAGDDPATTRICADTGARCLTARAGRGPQQHAGALAAAGGWLWFLHADALPEPGAVARIREAGRAGVAGGYFRFRFRGPDTRGRRLLAALINLRARLGTPYGDQGLFFRRDVYFDCGGFPDEPLFEEVPLVRRARRCGRFAALPVPLGVSPRRWERDGWLTRTAGNRLLALGYAMGISPRRLARIYENSKENRVTGQTRS